MEIEILSNVENKQLDRKEIRFSVIEDSSTPSREALKKELAQLTDVLGIVLNKCRYSDDSVGYNYEAYG